MKRGYWFILLLTISISNVFAQHAKQPKPEPPEFLTALQVVEDLDQFQRRLEKQFAYLKATCIDYVSAINAVRIKGADGLRANDLAYELQKIIGMFIDGHAGIAPLKFDKGYLPFLVDISGSRVVAVKPDRTGFLVPDFPFLNKIDNRNIEEWIAAGAAFRAQGSPQYRFRQGLRNVRNVQAMRAEMNLPITDSLDVELLSMDLTQTRTVRLAVATERIRGGRLTFKETGILENNIGYLRISTFSGRGSAVELIEEWMPKFRDTNGLIIDVRGNSGGSRAGLLALYPYLMSSDDTPSIANVCAYRLFEEFDEDHLAARFAYRQADPHWNELERDAIGKFMEIFTPQWIAPEGKFSDWHFVLLSKWQDDERYHYDKPVIILCNTSCFSATDIFLGALKGWRDNIKLAGVPSGGGSARSQRFQLAHSKLRVRCASMISFQRTGALYDTNGIHPDYLIYPEPEYFLENGRDNVFEKALKILSNLLEGKSL
ncbi:hypothetical protein KAR48_17680 [bacterium]|nr:hypothetical protein [bacterium]